MRMPERLMTPFWSEGPGEHYVRNLGQGQGLSHSDLLELLDRSRAMLMGMEPEQDTPGRRYAVATEHVEAVADLYRAFYDIRHHLPHVTAFVVGYHWGGDNKSWSGYFGCQGQGQADHLAKEVQKRWSVKYAHHTSDKWVVEHRDTSITNMIRPEANPVEIADALLRRLS